MNSRRRLFIAVALAASCTNDAPRGEMGESTAGEESASAPPSATPTIAEACPATEPTAADQAPPSSAPVPELAPTGSGDAASPTASASVVAAEPPVDPLVITLAHEPVRTDFEQGPFYFTGAFDGSLRYSLWLRLMEFSRTMKKQHEVSPHFTFFINAAFYSTNPGKSDVGKAMSRNEVLVRRALTQLAINDGHDIGDHGMGHLDGRNWNKAEWVAEFQRFHETMDYALFMPIRDEEGQCVFPRFSPVPTAEKGATGAACDADADCTSNQCVTLTDKLRVCTERCNLKHRCPTGTACGAPTFREDTDICVPVPTFPIELDGKTLFNGKGEPNLKHPALKPYRIIGFRAPYLAANDALYDALAERGYRYDTSQAAMVGPPFYVVPREGGHKVLEFALMLHQGGLTIPMDYNYAHLKASSARMQSDYDASLLASYASGHTPWNVGHHFALWEEGAYLAVLESTVDRVLSGCPDAAGKKLCEGGQVVSFRELAERVK